MTLTPYTIIEINDQLKLVGPGYESKLWPRDCRERLVDLCDLLNAVFRQGGRVLEEAVAIASVDHTRTGDMIQAYYDLCELLSGASRAS